MTAPSEDIPAKGTAAVEDIPVAKPPADPGTPRLAVENLRIVMRPSRGRPEADVVDQVSFTVQPGHVLGLVGESGSGKTTVALALLGLVKRGLAIGGGRVLIDGQDIIALFTIGVNTFTDAVARASLGVGGRATEPEPVPLVAREVT